eukprot:3268437-Alexandrium_andersonii.AAC.1
MHFKHGRPRCHALQTALRSFKHCPPASCVSKGLARLGPPPLRGVGGGGEQPPSAAGRPAAL